VKAKTLKTINGSTQGIFLLALGINAIILISFLALTELRYGPDESTIARAVAFNGYYYFPFTNYFLNAFIGLIQKITPFWNAWAGCHIVFSFAAFTAITFVFFQKVKEDVWMRWLGVCIVLVYAYNHYTVIQFTQTAALLMVAGSLLVVHAFLFNAGNKVLIAGCLLLCLGTWYRFQGIYVALGFAAIFLLVYLIKKRAQIRLLFTGKRLQVVIVIVMFLVIGVTDQVSDRIGLSTNELRAYREYNTARAGFLDYPKPDYSSNEEAFKQMGISEADYGLMLNWFLDSDTIASLENLKQINLMRETAQNKTINFTASAYSFLKYIKDSIIESGNAGVSIRFLLLLAILILVLTRLRAWPKYLLFFAAFLIFYLYLYNLGRTPFRALYIIDLAMAIWCAYSIRSDELRHWLRSKGMKKRKERSIEVAIAVIIVFIVAANSFVLMKRSSSGIDQSGVEDFNVFPQYVSEHPEKTFVFYYSANQQFSTVSPYESPLNPYQNDLIDNKFSFGGWPTMSPYLSKRLADRGLSNLFGDIIDNDSVFVVDIDEDSIWMKEQFFTDHYAPPGYKIVYERVDTVGGFPLWQVKTRPL